jgi:alkylation response protein AidB-like acyl-CoA dehydrogenase
VTAVAPAEGFRTDFVEACLAGATPATRRWYDELAALCAEAIAPRAAEHDRAGRYPATALAALAELGVAGALVPREHGGRGLPEPLAALLVETVASACPSTAAVLMFHFQVVRRTLEFGREPWRSADLARLADGSCLGSSAWTEIGAGGDKSGIRTSLVHTGEGITVTGEKHFCTGLEGVGMLHVLVDSSEGGAPSMSFARIPCTVDGIEFPEIYPLLGLRASSTGSVLLGDVHIEKDWILGAIGDGAMLMRLNHSFLMNPGLLALGIARAALASAKATVTGEERGSRDISGVQHCRLTIAEMETRLAAAYALATTAVARAAMAADAEVRREANLRLKLVAGRTAVAVAEQAMLLAGGRGFHAAWSYERHLRDAYATIVMGPPELVIAEGLAIAALAAPPPPAVTTPVRATMETA